MSSEFILIPNARCSFPQLWKEKVDGDQVFSRGITILLDKKEHKAYIQQIKEHMKTVVNENSKLRAAYKRAGSLKAFKGVCLRNEGEESWRPEYPAGHMLLRLGISGKKPPLVMHKNKTKATEEDDPIYSGCRVNVKFQVWGQANKWGMRINGKLIAIQFAKDDEPMDSSYVSEDVAADGFEELPDDIDTNIENDDDADEFMDM